MPYVKVNGETLFDAEFEQCSDGGKEVRGDLGLKILWSLC
jgi:hypothetical protein